MALHFHGGEARRSQRSVRVLRPCCSTSGAPTLDLRDDVLKSTPLGWACRSGRKELVEMLIARGALVNGLDSKPWPRQDVG